MALLGLIPGRAFNAGRSKAIFSACENTLSLARSRAVLPLKSIGSIQLCALVLLSVLFAPVLAHSQSAEYKLKAVYLFNFVQFTDWPTNAFANEKSPLIIGVLGNDPFGKALDDTVQGEVLKGRPLLVRRYKSIKEIKDCHVLYVSASETANYKSILADLRGRSILTVSDMQAFATNGGIIQFVRKDNKIGFRINTDAAKAANLSISSKLLQLAEVISNEKR